MTEVQKALFAMQDSEYRDFHSKLMPTVEPQKIIGVRVPKLRKYAAELSKTEKASAFMEKLPHEYYEENNVHAFLIERIKDFDAVLRETERFLPYIDNWATCDMFVPKVFYKNTDRLLVHIKAWLKSPYAYTVRFGLGMLMKLYLDGEFTPEITELAAGVKSEEYYVNMMIAWFFATALAKQYDTAIKYIENRRLDAWVHNKAIQKAAESRRVCSEKTEYLKTLKIKR
ncbi:MAG: DNA alkylation repair protein [Clostridiales bacterium]|nr:DNA alkylation repair protein [Clostridiales bacterium]